jgi:hypothetical protein
LCLCLTRQPTRRRSTKRRVVLRYMRERGDFENEMPE